MMDTEHNAGLEQKVRRVPAEPCMQSVGIVCAKRGDILDRLDSCKVAHVLRFFSIGWIVAETLASPPQEHAQVLFLPPDYCPRTAEPGWDILRCKVGRK